MDLPDVSRRNILLGVAAAATAAAPATAHARSKTAAAPKLAGIDRSEERMLVGPGGQQFRIQIGHPHPIEEGLPLMIRGRKPVPIYVLDGTENFPIVLGLTRMMQWGGSVPPCLIVGIAYADAEKADKAGRRALDLTPSANGPSDGRRFGGAAEFRAFIATKVKPLIESEFEVDAAQSTLVGHSFGGLFVLDTAVQQPDLFANLLALSPSLWFDKNLVLRQLKEALQRGAAFPHTVALAGALEQTVSEAKYNMTRNVEILAEYVAAAGRGDRVFARALADTTHHTIQGPGHTFGLRKLLDPTPPAIGAGCVVGL
ncbi:hypothetical protein GGC65_004229 [Sphingopyxis sp. OAS728]|uniref:alpha/beta hydrolase n=1 Tax=Sphingopyxis sp. OAS728 TaxID=2663823 RepID=UPI00178BD8DB|nr:alpha/beta hydrolase-fold protein [Sphingopyxis sp. OAS728]MBE1529773.1 hypothetical protein [Sphingopyxis sp. OAS728]